MQVESERWTTHEETIKTADSGVYVGSFGSARVAAYVVEVHHKRLDRRFLEWLTFSSVGASQVALALGVSKATVYGWASGEFRPSAANLEKLVIFSGGLVETSWFTP